MLAQNEQFFIATHLTISKDFENANKILFIRAFYSEFLKIFSKKFRIKSGF